MSGDRIESAGSGAFAAHAPGLILAAAVGAVGYALGVQWRQFGAVTFAIAVGFLVGNALPRSARTAPGLKLAEKKVLAVAIALLGLRLDLGALQALGGRAALLVSGLATLTIALGLLASRAGLGRRSLTGLVAVGTAICGSSAIAACTPALGDDDHPEDMGVAIGVVNLLGTLGIALVPAICVTLKLDERASALVVGGGLQAVGHVVAAGMSLGSEVGEAATAVKMGRVALLIPVVIALTLLFPPQAKRDGSAERKRFSLPLPGYLLGFLGLALAAQLGWIPDLVMRWAKPVTKGLLVWAMAAIGLRIDLKSLLKAGTGALVVGALLFAVQVGLLLLLG